MKTIKEVKECAGNVSVEGVIVFIEQPRVTNTGKKVANAHLRDDTDVIKLVLWEEKITMFKEGQRIRISGGYLERYQNEYQLGMGKNSKVDVIS